MERRANTPENPRGSLESFEHQWPQLRGQVKAWWDRLTDTDLEQVGGQKAQLVRLVQEKYGYARERAEQEVDRRIREYRDTAGTSTAEGVASSLAATASEVSTKVQDMATSAASSVAGTVGGAGVHLQDLPGDLVGLIRRYPIPSILVGLGIGFLLARTLGRTTFQRGDWETSARQREAGYPDAMIQCSRCGQLIRQADMVSHSATCTGMGVPGHGGSTS